MSAQEKGKAPSTPGARGSRRATLVSQDRWLVSYADLMTLLFALFVVLFATSRHSAEALGKLSGAIHSGFAGRSTVAGSSPVPAVEEENGSDALEGQLRAVLGDAIAKQAVGLKLTPDGLVLSFEELGFFHSGEAGLLPGQAATIEKAGTVLQQHGATLRVEGHSDDQPIHNAVFASNWELSAARAMTVLLLLVNETHYDPTRISVAGYGPYRPVADNGTVEGRQRNRRVDLVVIEPGKGVR